jgi:hypothetical protein
VEVGEVAAASAGDEYFLAGAVGVVEDEGAAVSAASFDGGHEAGGTGSEDEDVDFCHWVDMRVSQAEVVPVRRKADAGILPLTFGQRQNGQRASKCIVDFREGARFAR